jgi:ketosteroid isomerase-like protein
MIGGQPRKPVAAVTAKPAAKPAAGPAPVQATPASADIENAIANWAQAWSQRDVNAYLAAYASDFAASGMTRADWEAQRRARITAPKSIDVKISDLKIDQQGDTASATFRQVYRSDRLSSTATKTLKLTLQNGVWRIVGETSQ